MKDITQDITEIRIKLPTTSDLFKKHFNDYGSAGFLHPNMEAFFNDLNDVCKIEDAIKQINSKTTNKIKTNEISRL